MPSRRELVVRRVLRLGLVAVAAAGAVGLVATVPAAMLALAALPALAIAAAVVALAGGPRSWTAVAVALGWGSAVAAPAATVLNDALAAWLVDPFGVAGTRAVVPVVVGPLVEEALKAAALAAVLAGWRLGGVRDGVVCGAVLGLGFALAENAAYFTLAAVQDGADGVGRSVWLRGVVAPHHAVFTATAGAGIGRARRPGAGAARAGAAAMGVAAAAVQHVLWNGVAARLIHDRLCGASVPGGPCRATPALGDVLVAAPLVAAAFLAPAAIALAVLVARRDRGSEPARGVRGGDGPRDRATRPVREDDA